MNQVPNSQSVVLRFAHVLGIGTLLLANVNTHATVAQDISAFQKVLEANGYHLYTAPRANWGPGFVFAGDVNSGRITKVEEVCPNLYGDLDAPNKAKVVLANHKAEDSFSVRVAFDYLKGLTGFANDDSDLVRIEQQRLAEITWGDIYEMSYTRMDIWLETGEPRPVAKRCRSAIEDLKARRRFEGRVFVLLRAVAPDSLVFDFSRALSGSVGVTAGFSDRLKAGIQAKGNLKDGTRLEITEQLFVGYASPIKIEDWLPTGLVSPEIVVVRGTPSSLLIE